MAIILSLESSSEVCSICVSRNEELLSLVETTEPFSHTRKMTLFIKQCLDEAGLSTADLNAVAVSHGPGSYTGLRVSAATAKGLCFGLNIPLIAIDTLEAIAYEAKSKGEADIYIPMIDARRMEVYATIYNKDLEILQNTNNIIIDVDSFQVFNGQQVVLCGTGVEKCKEVFKTKGYDLLPFSLSASFIPPLAIQKYEVKQFENIVSYGPNYFKSPKVTKSKKPLF